MSQGIVLRERLGNDAEMCKGSDPIRRLHWRAIPAVKAAAKKEHVTKTRQKGTSCLKEPQLEEPTDIAATFERRARTLVNSQLLSGFRSCTSSPEILRVATD